VPSPMVFRAASAALERLRGSGGLLSCAGILRQHVVEHFGDELLLGARQARNRVELLFEFGNRSVPCATRGGSGNLCRRVIGDQRFNGDAEQLGQAWEHGEGHTALAAGL